MKPYFFVAGLPRSRTAFWANFLTFGDSFCHHEASFDCATMAELQRAMTKVPMFTNHIGNADPNLGLIPQKLLDTFPGARVVFIHRPIGDCVESLMAAATRERLPETNRDDLKALMERASSGLAVLARALPEGRRVILGYNDMAKESAAKMIWEFCIPGTPFPLHRWNLLKHLRVTTVMRDRLDRSPHLPFNRLMAPSMESTQTSETVLEKRTALVS
ncbi:MAG: sulfotransferase [Gemmatimonas sp.]